MGKITSGMIMAVLFTTIVLASDHAKKPDLWTVPEKTPHYVNRAEPFRKLQEFFSTHQTGKFAVTGISGAGKSELAIYYVNRMFQDYDIVWWFDAKRESTPQFHKFAAEWNATFLDPKDQIHLDKLSVTGVVTLMKSLLRKTSKSWIIIIDNADSSEAISDFIPAIHEGETKKKHVLITSQNDHDWVNQLSLTEFSEEEVIKYVSSELKDHSPSQIQEIVCVIERLPFYLVGDIRDIASKKVSIKDYIKKHKSKGKGAKMNQMGADQTNLNYKDKILDIQKSSPAAYNSLVLLSLKRGLALPKPIMEHFLATKHPETDFVCVAKILGGGSFMKELKAKNDAVELYSVDDIVQRTVREQITDGQARDFTNKLAGILVSVLDTQWEDLVSFTSDNPEIIALAQVVWDLALDEGAASPELFRLGLSLLEYHMFKSRDHNAYEKTFFQLKDMMVNVGSRNIRKDSLAKFYISGVYVRNIYHDEKLSDEVRKHLMVSVKDLDGSDDVDLYLRALYNTAQYYLFCADVEKAKHYLKVAEPILLKAKSASNKNLYWYICSWVYFEAGDFAECNHSLDVFFETFDQEKNNAIKLYAINMKANACLSTGKMDEAILWCNRSLKGALDYFQNEASEITAEALMIQAKAYLGMHKPFEARELLERSLPIYEDYFGLDKHSDQAIALRLMGETYMAAGDSDSALAFFVRAMSIYNNLYGEEFKGMAEVSRLLVLMAKVGVDLKREDIVQKHLRLHAKNFGATHPGTLAIFQAIDARKLV
jgi:tetratricopeptide (TPR) repeat protein